MNTTEQTKATATGRIIGIDLAGHFVKDPAKMIAFYSDVLGMTPTETDAEGRGAEFTLADGSTYGVWRPDDGEGSGAAIMFAVDDIPAAVTRFRAAGAALSDVTETPVCFMSFGQDPEGNGIIIHQRKVRD